MAELARHLADYAAYHRDRRNVATHMVGVPAIVFALEALLSRPSLSAGGLAVTPALILSIPATLFYLRLDLRFGMAMGALLALGGWAGLAVAELRTPAWLALGIGFFVGGWALQFVGHDMEGRKPAFLDDLKSLLIGPLFVLAEAAFALGLRQEVRREIEAAASRRALS